MSVYFFKQLNKKMGVPAYFVCYLALTEEIPVQFNMFRAYLRVDAPHSKIMNAWVSDGL